MLHTKPVVWSKWLTFLNFHFFPPRSAFFIFCSEFRPKVKGESPGLSIGEVAKRLGEMWNGTSSEDKQPYEKKAAKLKEKYEKVKFWWPAMLPQDVGFYKYKNLWASTLNNIFVLFF